MKVDIWNDGAKWDSFVESEADASNYHRWTWKQAIEDTYGHASYYLAASNEDVIQGVLPLFSIRSRIFGHSLVSVPFFSYGGVLARTTDARDALLGKAADLARELDAKHVELRQRSEDVPSEDATGWRGVASKVTLEIPLPATADEMWKRLSSGIRNKIRNGRKHGLRAEWGGIEATDQFYSVFATNMRNLGTPVYPRAWFENLCRSDPKTVRILTLWDGSRVVAAAFLNSYRDTLELPWSASLPDSRKKYSQVLLYWTFIEWAIQNGFRRIDLGRCTPGSGTHEFKKHWITEEKMLNWHYWLPEGAEVPSRRADDGQFRLAVRLWKRLPLFVANGIGPRIVRSIP